MPAIALFLSFAFFTSLNAQEEQEEVVDLGWRQPINLSQTGLTAMPELVNGTGDQLYAFWQNELDGYIVSILGDNGEWSIPEIGEPPFGTRAFEVDLPVNEPTPLFAPELVGDAELGISAFWSNRDDQLRYSQFITGNVTSLSSWTPPINLFNFVVDSSGLIDDDQRIHVAFVANGNGTTVRPGIYHRFSSDNGVTWSDPLRVYESSFFRQATPDTSGLNLFLGDSGTVYAVYDDPFKEQTLFSKLALSNSEEGATAEWGEPFIIDRRRRSDRPVAEGPNNIQAVEFQDVLHTFWIAGHGDIDCALYTRRSESFGEEWDFVQRLTDEPSDCPRYYRLLKDGDQLMLFTRGETKIEIRFWEEEMWSLPVNQLNLVEFLDPFSFRTVTSACPYQLEFKGNRLFALGCGSGNTDDIWVSNRPKTELQIPIDLNKVWRDPLAIFAGNNLIFTPSMTPDIQGFLHSVWTQNRQGYSSSPQVIESSSAIFYSRGDQGLWSTPSKIIEAEGTAENVSIAYKRNNGKLFVLWQDTDSQQILISQASSTSSFNPRDWSEPVAIPAPFANPSYPSIAVAPNGILFVLYAVPYNDSRGLYLTYSRDDGDTWSDPVSILSEVDSWDLITEPRVAFQPGGNVHITFINQVTASEASRKEYYYVRSNDSALDSEVTWTEPLLIQNRFLESNDIIDHDIE
ncbi:MAG: sialidase family protein, partial [Chloroflexota bacterium]